MSFKNTTLTWFRSILSDPLSIPCLSTPFPFVPLHATPLYCSTPFPYPIPWIHSIVPFHKDVGREEARTGLIQNVADLTGVVIGFGPKDGI